MVSKIDLFSQSLDINHRLRIKNGNLVSEHISVRKNSNCVYRLITRHQYSQSSILTKMASLYKQAEKNNSLTEEFLNNYKFLINKANFQNLRYQNTFCFSRFLKAKGPINTTPHEILVKNTVVQVKTPSIPKEKSKSVETVVPIVNPVTTVECSDEETPKDDWEIPPKEWLDSTHKVPGSDMIPTEDDIWWDPEDDPNDSVCGTANFGNLGCYRPKDFLKLINPNLIIDEEYNTSKVLDSLFETINLRTIAHFISADLQTVEKFKAHLKTNEKKFTDEIIAKFKFITLRDEV